MLLSICKLSTKDVKIIITNMYVESVVVLKRHFNRHTYIQGQM